MSILLTSTACQKIFLQILAVFFPKSPCDISSLPVEIFLEMFSYLPPVSQACLALTCKDLYRHFSTVFEANILQFPRWSPTREKYYRTYEYHQRMDLLVRLEDSRWACCVTCQKLHPHEEFIPYLPKRYFNQKVMQWSKCACGHISLSDIVNTQSKATCGLPYG